MGRISMKNQRQEKWRKFFDVESIKEMHIHEKYSFLRIDLIAISINTFTNQAIRLFLITTIYSCYAKINSNSLW